MSTVSFKPGTNIAMKVPPHLVDDTVRFYQDVLGFKRIRDHEPHVVFAFGDKNLWIDSVPTVSQAEIWLEVVTDNADAAADALARAGITRCDEIEELPDGLSAFWISNPASIVHLVVGQPPG